MRCVGFCCLSGLIETALVALRIFRATFCANAPTAEGCTNWWREPHFFLRRGTRNALVTVFSCSFALFLRLGKKHVARVSPVSGYFSFLICDTAGQSAGKRRGGHTLNSEARRISHPGEPRLQGQARFFRLWPLLRTL